MAQLPHVVTTLVASFTWIGFGIAGKSCFRNSEQKTPWKSTLVAGALVCTFVQLAAIVLAKPVSDAWCWTGVICFLTAHVLLWWALLTHGKARPAFAFTSGAPISLAQAGPYRVLRHPIYSAYLLAWIAAPLATAQLWLLLPAAAMACLYYRAARQEENSFLTSSFAPQYKEYQGRTGMFLPKIIRSSSRPANAVSELQDL